MTTQLKIFEHNIDRQKKQEEKMLAEYQQQRFTLDAPYICINPYLIAPLTAVMMFQTEQAVSVEAIIQGKTSDADIHLTFPVATEHVVEVVGLYAGEKNVVTLKTSDGKSSTIYLETATLPDNVVLPTVTTKDRAIWEDQLVFIVPTDPQYATAGYDKNGDCRWYTDQKFAYSMKRGKNGRILVGAPRLLAIPFSATSLYEMSLIGKIYKEYRLPTGYHESYFEMENHQMLFLTQNIEEGTSGDLIYLMDTTDGTIVRQWSLKDVLPQDVAGSGSQDMHDWFHANAIVYDADTNSMTISGRHQDIIVNLDFESGQINWMLGDPEGWPQEYVDQYFLKPDDSVEWFYEPNALQYIGKNVLLCFDSGHYRAKHKENYIAPEDNYSRAVVYQIDPIKKAVKQCWQYGKELGSDFYSTYMGALSVYGEQHIGIHSGGSATVDGKAIDLLGIFSKAVNPQTELHATTVEFKSGEEICKIVMPLNTYQAERIGIQHPNDKLQWGEGKRIGAYAKTEELPMEIPFVEAGMVPERYHLSFGYDGERLFLRADFVNAEMVLLYLEGEQEKHSFYIQSTRRPFYTMCMTTFRPGSARPVEWPINVTDFHDCYRLRLAINENIYETGLTLDLRKKDV